MPAEALSSVASPWRIAAAAVPLLVLLVGLLRYHWSGVRAGIVALAVAITVGVTVFATPLPGTLVAIWRGVALSLHVLYIIWGALLLYQVAEGTGAIRSIGHAVAHLTEDHILQLLILGFAFSTFLQGVAGFGVPVAVTAPLLVGLGFAPLEAAAVPLVGHAWSVTMGDMASSFQALLAVTDLPARSLGIWIASFLGLASIATAFAIAHIHAGTRPFRRTFGVTLALGVSMGGTQLLLAVTEHWIVASFGAGMVGLAVSLGLARLARRRGRGPQYFGLLPEWPPPEGRREPPRSALTLGERTMSFHQAFLPYYTLIVVVGIVTFVPPVASALDRFTATMAFPEVITRLGWRTEAEVFSLPVLSHPGALLAYTTVITLLLYRLLGRRLPPARLIWRGMAAQGVPTTLTILALVALAMVMVYSGMTFALARGMTRLVGPFFPFFAPFVGLLGTVITGSNTNSNVLFGAVQREAARLLQMDPVMMAALQTAGGSLGSMVAPAKVVLATVTTGLGGQEGRVMRLTLPYALSFVAGLGLLGLILEALR